MPKYYLLAEAFNINHVVYDTNDISTIRGGSFILLNAITFLRNAFEDRLKPIATAASTGLFAYEDTGDLDAQKMGMEQEVLRVLNDATDGYATFLVAVEKDIPDNFSLVLARLEAEVRRQQWRMPTVVVPSFGATDQECYLDGWRPGVESYPLDPMFKISNATYYRREKGRRLKHTLIRELFGEDGEKDDLCAKDLGELAIDPSKGILSGKIAFIHVDGNSFGSIRKKKCINPEAREIFDALIQKCRKEFLYDLRKTARSDPDFHVLSKSGKDLLRIEVLLWGGDECTIIVPAWKGLKVLERFYRIASNLAFEGMPMTHRAAVVFCHYNAPILQIRRLANLLLDMTKKNILERYEAAVATDPSLAGLAPKEWLSNPNYGNAARYLVLESFDMLRGSLEQFLRRYYGIADTSGMLLYADDMPRLRNYLQTICTAVPKGRIIEIAYAISRGNDIRKKELRKRLPESIAPEHRDEVIAAIDALTNDNDVGWYIMADLWDFAEVWKA